MEKYMATWTKEQLQAIEAGKDGGYRIVSAAAGSGKTSVLVERLLRLLTATPHLSAERIVVATFTNDAAAGMKQRLMTGLSRLLEESPDDVWLLQQQSALQLAKISTIHSFCFDLIRENVQSLEISAGFRIIEDSEETVLLRQALDEVMESSYASIPEVMDILRDCFCTKGDSALETVVLELYDFCLSIPFWWEWLKKHQEAFLIDDSRNNKRFLDWAAGYLSELKEVWGEFAEILLECSEEASEIGAVNAAALLQKESDSFRVKAEGLCRDLSKYSFDEQVLPLFEQVYERLTFPKMEKESEEWYIAEQIKKRRNSLKEKQRKWSTENLFTEQQIIEDLTVHYNLLGGLMELIGRLDKSFWDKKIEKNAIGFSDAEQLAIKLLSNYNADTEEISKTELARELSEYYELIMIDEFQDANNAQDLIFKMLSKGGTEQTPGSNLFVVGDVKQSIYRFRQANPEIFLKSLRESAKGEVILLNKNFRSRREIVSFVNMVFSHLMTGGLGELEYTDEQALVQGASFDESDYNYDTEILLIDERDSDKDESSGDDTEEDEVDDISEPNSEALEITKEAVAVANRIQEMIRDKVPVKSDDGQGSRACTPRDFCILVRNKSSGVMFSKALERCRIRANTDETDGYLKSREISLLLNLLQVIDNPLRDIPLASVLMSPLCLITPTEMARIRLNGKDEEGYDCLYKGVTATLRLDSGEQSSEKTKLERFERLISQLRLEANMLPLDRLIRSIYEQSDFLSVMQVYRDGEQKTANLRLLLEYARQYSAGNYGSVSGFIRYIGRISENGGDLKKAVMSSSAEDVVFIKTIHRSKGLEYPFVFLCRTSSRFNRRDLSKPMQMHIKRGIGFRLQDHVSYKRFPTLPYLAIRSSNQRELLSEELRLLYVALTRAKEKLFITLKSEQPKTNIPQKAVSMGDWVWMALLKQGDINSKKLKQLHIDVKNPEEAGNLLQEAEIQAEENEETINGILETLRQRTGAFYSETLSKIPAKRTVTEIVLSEEQERVIIKRPRFLTERERFTGAEKGTATHSFMQYADFSNAAGDPGKELTRLVENGLLTEKEAGAVQLPRLRNFFKSGLYVRIEQSKKFLREKKFLMYIGSLDLPDDDPLKNIYRETEGMLQGIADCLFQEADNSWVLVDYKTDFAETPGEIAERYRRQLELYKASLEILLGSRIKEAGVYAFHFDEYLPVIL